MNSLERTGRCNMCGECCKKMRITSVLSHILEQHGSLKDARAYYSFRGVRISEVHEKIDRVLLEMDVPCDQLTGDNRCKLADFPDKKPYICHRYPWFQDDVESCGFSFAPKKDAYRVF